MPKEKLYVFDVCGTMFHSNTTYDFLRYYFQKKNKVKFALCSMALSYPSKLLLVGLGKIGFKIELRSFLIGLLKGAHAEEVNTFAVAFVKEYLVQKKNIRIHAILKEALDQKEKVVLASASLDPVVKSIAAYFQVQDYYSAELEQNQNGSYTGKLKQDIKGEKLPYLQKAFGLEKYDVFVLTDNMDDLPLIKVAGKAFVVSKKRSIPTWMSLLDNHPNAEIVHV